MEGVLCIRIRTKLSLSSVATVMPLPDGIGKVDDRACGSHSLARGGRSYYTAPLKALVSEQFLTWSPLALRMSAWSPATLRERGRANHLPHCGNIGKPILREADLTLTWSSWTVPFLRRSSAVGRGNSH